MKWFKKNINPSKRIENNSKVDFTLTSYFISLNSKEKKSFIESIFLEDKIQDLKVLLPHITDFNITFGFNSSETERDFLESAIKLNSFKICKFLIKNKIYDINYKNELGNNYLLMALSLKINNYQVSEVINLLVDIFSLKINDFNHVNENALYLSLYRKNFLLVERIVKAGAKPYLDNNLLIKIDKDNNTLGIYKKLLHDNNIGKYYNFLNLNYYNVSFDSDPLIFESEKEMSKIFNIKNKDILKRIEKNKIFNGKVNTNLMNFIYIVKQSFPNIDDQLLKPLIKGYHNFSYSKISISDIEFIKKLFMFYPEKRMIKLISNFDTNHNEYGHLISSAVTFKKIRQLLSDNDLKNILPKKPKSFEQISILIKDYILKIEQPNIKLNQHNIIQWHNKHFEDYLVSVPKTSHDLITLGTELNNCIGNGYYSKRINIDHKSILSLKKDNKNIYCILFSSDGVYEARGNLNQHVPNDIVSKFNKFIDSNFDPKV
jgi:hypothetical protein